MMHARRHAAAFSLIELMIAIMILGLGMVMVATVFPVTFTITRDTVQMNVSQSVVDAAYATLKLRMPKFKGDLDGEPAVFSPRVIFANSVPGPRNYRGFDLFPLNPDAIESDFTLETTASEDELAMISYPPNPLITAHTVEVAKTRSFTEAGFWDVERQPPGTVTTLWAVASQNLLCDPPNAADPGRNRIVLENPPFINQGVIAEPFSGVTPYVGTRIHLADRVYPPFPVLYAPEQATDQQFYDQHANQVLTDLALVDQLVSTRRYSWTAFAGQTAENKTKNNVALVVMTTVRSETNARFAKQAWQNADGFDFRGSGGRPSTSSSPLLRNPSPLASGYDTIYPQPWLVMFDLDTATGLIGYYDGNNLLAPPAVITSALPVDAYFVVAQSVTVGSKFQAGAFFKIAARESDPNTPGMQMPRMATTLNEGIVQGVVAWVIPPPIDASRTRFGTRTPVTGVFQDAYFTVE